MECKYELYQNGKKVGSYSEAQLAAELLNIKTAWNGNSELKAVFEDGSREVDLFSIESKFEAACSRADGIRSMFSGSGTSSYVMSGSSSEDPDIMRIHDRQGYVGITSFIEQYGNPKSGISTPILPPFDESSWERKTREKLSKAGVSDTQIDTIIKDTKNSWNDLQKIGDDIHGIYEDVFNDASIRETNTLDSFGDVRESVISQAQAFKKELIRLYGAGDPSKVKFYPELEITAKELDPDLKILLESKSITNVCGIIDLLVIDSNGQPHIFDYKTSRRKFDPEAWNISRSGPDMWTKDKKEHVKNQLAAYNAMLQQYGFGPASCEVVPIFLDIEYKDIYKSSIDRVLSVDQNKHHVVPETNNGRVYLNWKSLVPIKVELPATETIELFNKFKTLMPVDHITSMEVQQFEASAEWYKRNRVKDVMSDDPKYGTARYYFVKHETTGRREYAVDDEDLDRKLQAYTAEVRTKKANELTALATTIKQSLSGTIDIDSFIQDYNISNPGFLKTQFGRYINGGWNLVSDDNMIRAGLFEFRLGNRSEIIVMTNSPIHDNLNLGLGTSLLGRFVEDQYIDSKTILRASNGNIEAMKAMIYVAEHPELFTDTKIVQIVTMNPWSGHKTNVQNSQWIENYNQLVEKCGEESGLKLVNPNVFYDDLYATMSLVDSYLESGENPIHLSDLSTDGIGLDLDVTLYTEDFILDALDRMKRKFPYLVNGETFMQGNENVWLAYNYLYSALLTLRGLHTYSELEPGLWLKSGIRTGLYVNSAGYSPSTNFRVFDDVMQQYALEVRLAVEKQGRPLIPALNNFYNEMGRAKIVGGEAKYFLRWFKRDSDNKIDKSFSLKHPSEFHGAEKEAIETWLNVMAELKYREDGQSEEDFQLKVARAKADESYYEVPLTEAAFSRQVTGVGLFKAFKNKVQQYTEMTQDVFAGASEDTNERTNKYKWRKNHRNILFNKLALDSTSRVKLIEEHGVGFFETNLEDVIYQALVLYNKTKLSRKYIPIIDGMRVALRVERAHGGTDNDATLEAFDKLVNSKFYGENIIDPTLVPYAKWIGAVKSLLSKLQLGFNFRSFFRELFQGTWMGLSRSSVQMLPGVDAETYSWAATYVAKESWKNFSNVSLLQQMNSQYGMANYSMSNIARQRRMNWWGIKNFRTDTLFLTSSAPDFQHRMAILIAKMKADDCWDAHYLDENGFLKYDFSKDSRFSVYLSGDTTNPLYIDQKTEYLERIAELNRVGMTKENGEAYKEGDDLPMAYTPKEIQAIKNYADLLYGHYDDESKSLMNDMFLGSLFLQYKTYTTSRVEQWVMTPGVYNTEMLEHDMDEVTGEKLYRVHSGIDEYGMPRLEIKTRSQLESEGRDFNELVANKEIEACMSWKGIPMEGMARSYLKFATDVLHWDWAEWKRRWNEPIERDNILLGLHDCLFMSLMMLLMTALFGIAFEGEWTTDHQKIARAMQKNGWGPSLAYNIAYGSFQDFPFWQVGSSMFSDLNPTAITSAKRIIQNTGAVIMGNKTIFQAATNTIGALNDLRGVANNIANTVESI